MFNFEDKELIFYINGTQIKIGPFSEKYFYKIEEKHYNEEDFNSYDFRLTIIISEAISKYEGFSLVARHQSGGVAYEGWMNDGSFYKHYTVYSDYVDLHSIDMGEYSKVRKNLKVLL